MATRKECNCIENALRAMKLATEIKDASFFYIQTGHDPELKSMYTGTPYEVAPPKGAKSLLEIINNDASELDKELRKLEANCEIDWEKTMEEKRYDYIQGKNALAVIMHSQGRNLDAAYIVGDKISNSLQVTSSKKKLLRCKG